MSDENDDRFEEHEILQKITKKYNISNESLTHIKGYLAKSPIADCIRLFTNLNFDVSVDIPKNKILHVEKVSNDRMEFGGTCIWLPKDAEITYTRVDRSKIEARFLEGNIMRDYLGSAKDLDFRKLLFETITTNTMYWPNTLLCGITLACPTNISCHTQVSSGSNFESCHA